MYLHPEDKPSLTQEQEWRRKEEEDRAFEEIGMSRASARVHTSRKPRWEHMLDLMEEEERGGRYDEEGRT